MANGYLILVLALLVGHYLLELVSELLNLRRLGAGVPDEFKGWYDAERYARSQAYQRENTRFGLLQSGIMLALTVAFIVLGGFKWVNQLALAANAGMIVTGLLFTGLLLLIAQLVELPFSLYDTFVIEEKYGFNKTTPKTFVMDMLKGWLLTALIGAPVLAAVLWFFARAGDGAWLYCWVALTVIQLALTYLAPVLILPLFNKFLPLEDGELKSSIEDYARRQNFKLRGIFKIDGSRRSTKSNAYFTGFGRWRRIALFDTLIAKHTVRELVAVLAHEVGHYRKGHIWKHLLVSLLSTGLMLFILSLFLTKAGLYAAFGLDLTPVHGQLPIYAGLVFFGFLYTPIALLLGVLTSAFSRRHEYAADAFAAQTTQDAESMIVALKKLSVDHLAHLTPHPLKVVLEYSHPPVLERIRALRRQPGALPACPIS